MSKFEQGLDYDFHTVVKQACAGKISHFLAEAEIIKFVSWKICDEDGTMASCGHRC